MPWREATRPTRMQRVAVVAPVPHLRDVLVRVADAGTVELVRPDTPETETGAGSSVAPVLARTAPDRAALERDGRRDLAAGEAELDSYTAAAMHRGQVAALAGWTPVAELDALAGRLAEVGGGIVPLAMPPGLDPPTLLRPGGTVHRSLSPLVDTYATVPYRDLDPTVPAGVAYVLMFGMMFGDVGDGVLLALAGLLLRSGRPRRLARFRQVWPFVVGAGLAATFFGLLYGDLFGPTGLVPVLWLAPLDAPVTLLSWALGVGGVLLAGSYVAGSVNRWREGGWPVALVAASGIAGATLFSGAGGILIGVLLDASWLVVAGGVLAVGGLALSYLGFLAAAGGGGAGVIQAAVELFDTVLRLGTNLVSFARLAAFGLTHAALGLVVWDGTVALWGGGGLLVLAAVLVFVVGNALAFGLEALVAGIQALRLEYYELFSRVFTLEGRPFRPWHVPLEERETHTSGRTS